MKVGKRHQGKMIKDENTVKDRKVSRRKFCIVLYKKSPRKEVGRAQDRWRRIGSHPQYRDQCREDSPGTSPIRTYSPKSEKALKGDQTEIAWDLVLLQNVLSPFVFVDLSAFNISMHLKNTKWEKEGGNTFPSDFRTYVYLLKRNY